MYQVALQRIQDEFRELSKNPLGTFGITVGLINDNPFQWKCTILGPKDTCYRGGLFHLKITFPIEYPNRAPEIVFETPIYHLNVKYFVGGTQPLGHICLSTLNAWQRNFRMSKVLPEIFDLLYKNNINSPYDEYNCARRNEYIKNKALFEEKAQYFTKKYADPRLSKKVYTTNWDFTYIK